MQDPIIPQDEFSGGKVIIDNSSSSSDDEFEGGKVIIGSASGVGDVKKNGEPDTSLSSQLDVSSIVKKYNIPEDKLDEISLKPASEISKMLGVDEDVISSLQSQYLAGKGATGLNVKPKQEITPLKYSEYIQETPAEQISPDFSAKAEITPEASGMSFGSQESNFRNLSEAGYESIVGLAQKINKESPGVTLSEEDIASALGIDYSKLTEDQKKTNILSMANVMDIEGMVKRMNEIDDDNKNAFSDFSSSDMDDIMNLYKNNVLTWRKLDAAKTEKEFLKAKSEQEKFFEYNPKLNWLYGTLGEFNNGLADIFSTADNLVRSISDLTTGDEDKLSGGAFYEIAKAIRSTNMAGAELPETVGGGVVGGVARMAPLLMTLALFKSTPTASSATLGAEAQAAKLFPNFVKYTTTEGFANAYAEKLNQKGSNKFFDASDYLDIAGGTAEGMKFGITMELLGIGAKEAEGIVSGLTGSSVAGGTASLLVNSLGMGGSEAVKQIIDTGEIYDYKKVAEELGIGAAFGASGFITPVVKEIRHRATMSLYKSALAKNKAMYDIIDKVNKTVSQIRQNQLDVWKQMNEADTPEKRMEIMLKANMLNNVANMKVFSENIGDKTFYDSVKNDINNSKEITDAERIEMLSNLDALHEKYSGVRGAVKKINQEITNTDNKIKSVQEDKTLSEAERTAYINSLNKAKAELQKQMEDAYENKSIPEREQAGSLADFYDNKIKQYKERDTNVFYSSIEQIPTGSNIVYDGIAGKIGKDENGYYVEDSIGTGAFKNDNPTKTYIEGGESGKSLKELNVEVLPDKLEGEVEYKGKSYYVFLNRPEADKKTRVYVIDKDGKAKEAFTSPKANLDKKNAIVNQFLKSQNYDTQNKSGVRSEIGIGQESIKKDSYSETGEKKIEANRILQAPPVSEEVNPVFTAPQKGKSYGDFIDQKAGDIDINKINTDVNTYELAEYAKNDGLELKGDSEKELFHDLFMMELDNELNADKTVKEIYEKTRSDYKVYYDDIVKGITQFENYKLINPKADGSSSTSVSATYDDARESINDGETTSKNIYVRQSPEKSNKGRVLLVQFASDFMGTKMEKSGNAEEYFDKLYKNREGDGYMRLSDFWEVPMWIANAAHTVENSDVYVVRDMGEFKDFLNESGYNNIAFSVLDVTKDYVKDIANSFPEKRIIAGGYVDAFKKDKEGVPKNISWFDDMEGFAKSMGVKYKPGYSYRHFKGSGVIPRLKMSSGCKYKCAFCTVPKKVESVSKDVIDQQVSSINDLNANLVYLDDKTFGDADNYKYLEDVYKKMKSFNPDFNGFIIQTTAGVLANKLDVDFLKNSGIKYVELGVESYNDKILGKLHKPASEKVIDKAVDKLRSANIRLIPNIVIGFHGADEVKKDGKVVSKKQWSETNETYQKTYDFLERNKDVISHVNLYNLALYEGTELSDQIDSKIESDRNENIVKKSYQIDPEIHQKWHDKIFDLSSRIVDQQPSFIKKSASPVSDNPIVTKDNVLSSAPEKKSISEKAKSLSDKILSLQTVKPGSSSSITLGSMGSPEIIERMVDEVRNMSLRIAAETVRITGDVMQAVHDAIKYIKDTDWYGNLSYKDKKNFEKSYYDYIRSNSQSIGDETAKQLNFSDDGQNVILYSYHEPDLKELNPKKTEPNAHSRAEYKSWGRKRIFFYTDPSQKEKFITGKLYQASVPINKLYDLIGDPLGLFKKGKELYAKESKEEFVVPEILSVDMYDVLTSNPQILKRQIIEKVKSISGDSKFKVEMFPSTARDGKAFDFRISFIDGNKEKINKKLSSSDVLSIASQNNGSGYINYSPERRSILEKPKTSYENEIEKTAELAEKFGYSGFIYKGATGYGKSKNDRIVTMWEKQKVEPYGESAEQVKSNRKIELQNSIFDRSANIAQKVGALLKISNDNPLNDKNIFEEIVGLMKDIAEYGVLTVAELVGKLKDEIGDAIKPEHWKEYEKDIMERAKEFVPEDNTAPPTVVNPSGQAPVTGDVRQKSFFETVQESGETTIDLADRVKKEQQFYDILHNEDALAAADKLVSKDFEKAKEFVLSNAFPTAEKSLVAIRLMKHYESIKDYESALKIMNSYEKQLRDAGRFIQTASLWNSLKPSTIIGVAEKMATKLGKRFEKNLTEQFKEAVKKELLEINSLPEGEEKVKRTLEVLNAIADKFPLTVGEYFDAYRYTNMLSNIRSHERNIFGNLLNTFLTYPMKLGAMATYDLFKNPFDPMSREYKFSDVPSYLKRATTSIPMGLRLFGKALKSNEISDKIMDIPSMTNAIQARRMQKMPGFLTFVPRLLNAQDMFFSYLISEGETARNLKNGKSESYAKQKGQELAQKYLYRDPLKKVKKNETSHAVRAINNLGVMIQKIRDEKYLGPQFGWVVPFIKTPVKLAALGVEFSPLGFIGGKHDKDQISSAMLGSIFAGLGSMLAYNNMTTWAPPQDQKEKELFYASGKKPYSVKIGDAWVPMSYFGPFAFSMAMPAALKHYWSDTPGAMTDTAIEKISKGIISSGSYIITQTPFSGIESMLDIFDTGESNKSAKSAGFMSQQFVPLSGLIKYTNYYIDPVYRNPKTDKWWDKYKQTLEKDIPFLSKDIEPIRTPEGQIVERDPAITTLPYDIGIDDEDYNEILKIRRKKLQIDNALNEAKKQKEKEEKPKKYKTKSQQLSDQESALYKSSSKYSASKEPAQKSFK